MSTIRLSDLDFAGEIYEFEDLLAQNRLDHLTYATLTAMEEDASLEVNDSAVVNGGIFDIREVVDVDNEEDMTDPDTIYYYNGTHYDGNSGNEAIGFETVNGFAMLSDKNTYVTPEMFGAVGNGIADDTAPIQKMFDRTKNTLLFFPNKYKVTETIISSKPKNIMGSGANSYIHAETSNPILKFEYNESDTNDYRNFFIKNLNVYQQGDGHAVAFTNWEDRLMNMLIENCKFYGPDQISNGYGLYCENSLAHSIILNCQFRGNGAYLNCRDANLIEKCFFWGKGNGIVLNPAVYGCLNNAVKNCTIVNTVGNAILVIDGEQVVIENNQIEYANQTDEQTAEYKALVALISNSETRNCSHVIIRDNNFGGGAKVTNQIIIDDASDTLIENNRFGSTLNAENIKVNSISKRTIIRQNNYASTNGGVKSNIIVKPDGEVIGYPVVITNSGVTSLVITKNENGYVSIRFFNLLSGTNRQIATLPSWLVNQSYQNKIRVLSPSNEMLICYLSPTGLMTIDPAVIGDNLETGLYYPMSEYYCGFTY